MNSGCWLRYSFGDGVTFPIRTVDEDYDRLLGDRQRWMEEGDEQGGGGDSSSDNNIGEYNFHIILLLTLRLWRS